MYLMCAPHGPLASTTGRRRGLLRECRLESAPRRPSSVSFKPLRVTCAEAIPGEGARSEAPRNPVVRGTTCDGRRAGGASEADEAEGQAENALRDRHCDGKYDGGGQTDERPCCQRQSPLDSDSESREHSSSRQLGGCPADITGLSGNGQASKGIRASNRTRSRSTSREVVLRMKPPGWAKSV